MLLARARARVGALKKRLDAWAGRQEPGSVAGVAIDAWRRYRAVDGPLESALLSLYILVAVVPALLVMEEYLETDPGALADHIVRHYGLSATTGELVRSVLVQGRSHELGSALFAIAGALFFGLNFGRVLQNVHARAWRISLPSRGSDYPLYAVALLGLYGLILLLLVQLKELAGDLQWARLAVAPGWLVLLTLYFLWLPRLLLHGQVRLRDLLPGAALTAAGVLVVMLGSSFVMEPWVDLYARDYGGFGVVMAIFFWIGFSSAVIVLAASLSPALAQRRELRTVRGQD
jgi:membrane protein